MVRERQGGNCRMRSGGSQSSGLLAHYLLTVAIPECPGLHTEPASVPKIRPDGWAAVPARLVGETQSRHWGQERGLRLNAPCCLGTLGRPGCTELMRFLGNFMPSSCLLPGGLSPAPAYPRGTGGSAGSTVPGCFQVLLCLTVMSAWLTGTRPSSGVYDSTGVLEQPASGLGGCGGGVGKELSVGSRGRVGAGRKMYPLLSRCFVALVRVVPPKLAPGDPGTSGGGGSPKAEAPPHLEFHLNPESIEYQ